MTPSQWPYLIEQLFGVVSFSSNIVLPTQAGYFEADSDGEPFLHIWSLSLEEQYYLLLPIYLFLLPKKARVYALFLMFFLRFIWCLSWLSDTDQSPPVLWRVSEISKEERAFYLLPTRAWGLLSGSLCAWLMISRPQFTMPPILKALSVISILFVSCVELDSVHHRGNSILAVVATSIVVRGKDNWLPNTIVLRSIERIGDWSYSIYLVHWPMFAFSFLIFLGDTPVLISAAISLLALLALLFGYLQFRFVESIFGVIGYQVIG